MLSALIRRLNRLLQSEGPPASHENSSAERSLSAPKLPGTPISDDSKHNILPNPATVGLMDIVESGWYNSKTHEICPGVTISPGEVVVDIGCGDGGSIKFCAAQGADVVLLDIDEGKVTALEEELRGKFQGSIRGIVGSGESIDLPDEFADKVVSTEVLEHVDHPEKVLRELARIGKRGAMYLLTVPHEIGESMVAYTAPPQYFEKPNHVRVFSEDGFRALVAGQGLEILRHEQSGAYWSIYLTIFWLTGGSFAKPDSPALTNWASTWHEILKHEKSSLIKAALDAAIPNKQFILARKPFG